MEKSKRGFASIDPEVRKAIARKGGLALAQNREHMSKIGIKGGEASGRARAKKSNNLPPET